MDYQDFIKLDRFPTSWCAGCGAGLVLKTVAQAFEKMGLTKSNTAVVSGIGCTGRGAGYFALDSVHGLHGRAIPLAEGMKLSNPELNISVFSGDGDLLSIGGNHLIHACRRDTDITVICVNNNIYGMTGGQKAPTTPRGTITLTSPEGATETPINAQALVRAHGNFYARTTVTHIEHMNKCILEAIKHKGFSFVEIISPCTSNYGRRLGYKTPYDMMINYKERYKIVSDVDHLSEGELGILI
ncbi:MAG: thiamine pyrophosphate-dependent enzyme [Candidatus Woesearchaeota archaeon]